MSAGLIASLGMYDSPANGPVLDRLWSLIAESLRDHAPYSSLAPPSLPDRLTRGAGAYLPAWTSPDLLLSQTCGYPFRSLLRGQVRLVGAPDHGLSGTPPGYYHSVLVARAGDRRETPEAFDGAGLVFNDPLSQSGWAAPWADFTARGLALRPVLCSGGHRASARALAAGAGDLAAIDAVTWAMMGEDGSGDDAGLKVISRTPPSPALPFITALSRDASTLARAVSEAISALNPAERRRLHLNGLVSLTEADYWALANPPKPDILSA